MPEFIMWHYLGKPCQGGSMEPNEPFNKMHGQGRHCNSTAAMTDQNELAGSTTQLKHASP